MSYKQIWEDITHTEVPLAVPVHKDEVMNVFVSPVPVLYNDYYCAVWKEGRETSPRVKTACNIFLLYYYCKHSYTCISLFTCYTFIYLQKEQLMF